jgi:hypothetical protein
VIVIFSFTPFQITIPRAPDVHQLAFHGFERRTFGRVDLSEQALLEFQRGAFVGRHLARVLEILPHSQR